MKSRAGVPSAFPADGTASVLVDALQRDVAATARRLGAVSVRASVVDLATMTTGSTWTIAEQADAGPDSAFSTAPSSFAQLTLAPPEETLVRRLSPRRWAFAWRLDTEHAVLGEAQFSERRDSLDATATVLLRLLCASGMQARAGRAADREPADLAWPRVDRRARPRPTALDALMLGGSVTAVLLCAWLAFAALPRWSAAHEAQRERLAVQQQRSESTVSHRLANALSTGDYGEVQTELSALATLGYLKSAVVTNSKQRIVAVTGPAEGLRIGGELGTGTAALRRVALQLGTQEQGALWLAGEPDPLPQASPGLAMALAGIALAGALVPAVLLALRWRSGSARRPRT